MGVKGKHRIAPFMSSDSPRSSRLDVVTRGGSEQQEITFQIFTMKAESDKCERPRSILKKTAFLRENFCWKTVGTSGSISSVFVFDYLRPFVYFADSGSLNCLLLYVDLNRKSPQTSDLMNIKH